MIFYSQGTFPTGFPTILEPVYEGLKGWEGLTASSPEVITQLANPVVMAAMAKLAEKKVSESFMSK